MEGVIAACCGSRRWQELMQRGLPYASTEALLSASEQAFDALSRGDWLEAFAAHSVIGAPRPGDRIGAGEQAGIAGAGADLRTALASANRDYRERFGFVFLIRARGRDAAELLAELRLRIENPPEVEFANACAQQREITALRLGELLSAQPTEMSGHREPAGGSEQV
jgi:2-oxo-4-hydroxy-4-carboxy-5-ureidoimidazoline decarboxylase